jgi:hypothetical protein
MAKQDKLHIHTHIEKTAGNSVMDLLSREELYGPQGVYSLRQDSDQFAAALEHTPNKLLPKGRISKAIRALSGLSPALGSAVSSIADKLRSKRMKTFTVKELPESARVITGHFNADRYQQSGELDPSEVGLRTAVVRDPLDRMISHYKHWKDLNGAFKSPPYSIPFSPNVTLEQFAFLPELQNFQQQRLGSIPKEMFDLIGTVEKFDLFAAQLALLISGISTPITVPHRNENPNKSISPEEKSFRENKDLVKKFKAFHQQDYELYAYAQSLEPEPA